MSYKPLTAFLAVLVCLGLAGCYGQSRATLGTPIPTYIPATPPQMAALELPPPAPADATPQPGDPCRVHAMDLLGAWVTAQTPESDPFPFTGLDGAACEATFQADVLPLFTQANLWYAGAPPCIACHYNDVKTAWAQLDLSSYAGILAGSRRASAEAKGSNILGQSDAGSDWNKAILFTQISSGRMPPGHPPVSDNPGPVVQAGVRK